MIKISDGGFATRRLVIMIPIMILCSCDCYRTAEGIIFDSDSGLPIENVQIVNNNDFDRGQTDHLVTSDEEGKFQYDDISGGLFGCPDLVLVFSKKGYLNQRISMEEGIGTDTIYLQESN